LDFWKPKAARARIFDFTENPARPPARVAGSGLVGGDAGGGSRGSPESRARRWTFGNQRRRARIFDFTERRFEEESRGGGAGRGGGRGARRKKTGGGPSDVREKRI